MASQIFKSKPDIIFLKNLLEDITEKENEKYIINTASFKKGIMFNSVQKFCELIKDNYYDSKKFYIERKMTYKYFLTIIRQLCKICGINYETETKYNKSTYEIVYFINVNDFE